MRIPDPPTSISFADSFRPPVTRAERRERERSTVALDEVIGSDIARIRLFGRHVSVVVSRDEWIHEVLFEKSEAFAKGPLLTVNARPLLGDGLLTSGNDLNRRQRRVISPAFAHKRVADYAATVSRYTLRETDCWQDGATIDLPHEMLSLTLGIIGELLLGDDLLREAKGVGSAIITLMNYAINQSRAPLRALAEVPRAYAALRYLNGILRHRIHDRLSLGDDEAAAEADLLTRLVLGGGGANSGGSERMPPRLVRDETMTLFLAGLETVAVGLVWSQYLMATHPTVYARVQAELDALGHSPGYEDLPRLSCLLQVFKEAMRLFPPAYIIARQAIEPVKIGPHLLERGTVVLISPYVQHRRPDHFSDSLRFDPERWSSPDAERTLPGRYAYMPFGGGPHVCIGGHFAMMEAHLILALIAQRFTLRLAPGQPSVTPEPLFTLRPREGVRMVVERR